MKDDLEQEPSSEGFFMPEESEERKESPIARLLRYSEMPNIADELDDKELNRIGQAVVKEYDLDDASRADWLKTYDKAMDIAKQAIEEKNYPWPKAANIKYPLITTAAIQFHARAYPAIIKGNDVAKGAVVGYDPDGRKAKRAERIGKHMSHQLLNEMTEWEEEMDKLLLIFSIVGSDFKKTYYDPIKRRNVSERVSAKDVVVNYWAKSGETAPRITHRLDLYPYQIEERVRAKIYLKQDLPNVGDDPQKTEEFLEQHRLEDLDEDGYPEPYCVTVHKETSKVVRITASYDEEAIFVDGKSIAEIKRQIQGQNQQIQAINMQMAMQYRMEWAGYQQGIIPVPPMEPNYIPPVSMNIEAAEVQRIEPVRYFTKYGFMPSLDGGFYDAGLGTLLLALNEAINADINQMLDAGHTAIIPSGFIGSNLRLGKKTGGDLRFAMGEFKRVDTGGTPVRDAIVYNQFPGPSAVLFNLLGMLIEAGRETANVKDIMSGDASANMPATTTIALIEQGQQVFSSIYKRIHRSLKSELAKLRRLNARYLPPQSYFTVLDSPEPQEITIQDYQEGDVDVIPISDPNLVTKAQRMALAQAMMPMAADPTMDGMAIKMEYLDSIGVQNPQRFVSKQPPSPPPELMAEMERLKIEMSKAQDAHDKTVIELLKAIEEIKVMRTQAIKNIADAEAKEIGAQVAIYAAQTEAATRDIEEKASASRVRSDGADGGMAGEPGNTEVPQVPGGSPNEMGQLPAELGAEPGPGIAGPGIEGAPSEGGAVEGLGGPVG